MGAIRKKVDKAFAKIVKLHDEIALLRDTRPHPPEGITYKFGARTGGYDHPDEYWTDYWCSECGDHCGVEGSIRGPTGSKEIR